MLWASALLTWLIILAFAIVLAAVVGARIGIPRNASDRADSDGPRCAAREPIPGSTPDEPSQRRHLR